MKSLRNMHDGLPQDKVQQLEPDLLLWEVADHTVIYRRIKTARTLRFISVKPLETE